MIASCVEVSFARPEALGDPARRRAALDLLTADERRRLDRFQFERDRTLHLAARALVRRSLSRSADVPPQEWRFAANAHGRPEIAVPHSQLRFSTSHTQGLAMVAVALRLDIGADAERLPASVAFDVVDGSFAPSERRLVRAAPADEQAARFTELWTLKEAYVKARGLGLSLALEGFAFELEPPRLVLGDDAAAWQVELMTPTSAHRAAVCVRRSGSRPLHVSVRWDDG